MVRKATYFKCGIKTKYCEYCKKNVKFKTYKKVPNITIKAKNNAFKNKIEIKVVKIPKCVSYYEIRIKNNSGNKVLKKVKSKSDKVVFGNLKNNKIYKIQYRSVVSKNGKTAKSGWYKNRVSTKR